MVEIEEKHGKRSDRNQLELIKFVASYCLDAAWMNIQVSYSSVITCQYQVKITTGKMQGKTGLELLLSRQHC